MIVMATRVLLVVWALLSGACSLRAVNTGTLVASTAALACDWAQTRGAAAAGWEGVHENNPVMGPTPSTATVDAYFFAVAIVNAAIWHVTPESWRPVTQGALISRQSLAIVRNSDPESTGTICGI
jgi:hypothetical protein